MSTLQIEEFEDRVVITLNRPEARNAINAAMIGELHNACTMLEYGRKPSSSSTHVATASTRPGNPSNTNVVRQPTR